MPLIKAERRVEVVVGFTCDRCGSSHDSLQICARFQYEFGYGTPHDGDLIDATLCDYCANVMFADLVLPAGQPPGAENAETSVLNPGEIDTTDLATNVFRPLHHAVSSADDHHAEVRRAILATVKKFDAVLYQRLVEVCGDPDGAARYLCKANPYLRTPSPIAMLAEGRRQDVLDELGRIEAGVCA